MAWSLFLWAAFSTRKYEILNSKPSDVNFPIKLFSYLGWRKFDIVVSESFEKKKLCHQVYPQTSYKNPTKTFRIDNDVFAKWEFEAQSEDKSGQKNNSVSNVNWIRLSKFLHKTLFTVKKRVSYSFQSPR